MKPSQSKVSVHVDVFVDGAKVTTPPRRQSLSQAVFSFVPFSIVQPTTAGDTPVIRSAGINYIEASGASLFTFGHYPLNVYAKAFPQPNISPADPANWEPPFNPDGSVGPTAVSTVPNADGTWAFRAGNTPPGNAVPGAFADSTPNGAVNSTLLVWYEYGITFDGGQFQYVYSVERANFHGYIPGGSGSMPVAFAATPAHLPAMKLVASFTGALSALGSVNLSWNGASWVGTSSHGGGSVLSLSHVDHVYQLLCAGPAASFIVAGSATSFRPFGWGATGTAVGHLHGSFKVTITE